MPSLTLHEIAILNQTDKSFRHDYCTKYERYVGHLRSSQFNLLEIGIMKGASLRTWEQYFSSANIFGLDIDPTCKAYESDRTRIFIGDQANVGFLRAVEQTTGPLSLIVDDGSHVWSDIITTFETLFPLLLPGGIYVIEDLHTSYNFKFAGTGVMPAINYLKSLVDNVNVFGQYGEEYKRSAAIKREFVNSKQGLSPNYQIAGIHFYPSICFIEKEL